jgi:predicted PurR-regulated permease PerM
MLSLINILIAFFVFLISCQLILASNIVEGLENQSQTQTPNQYQSYDTNNPNNALILAQQNAGNVEYLKQRIDGVQNIFQQVQDLSGNVTSLQTQMNGLLQSQQDYANQLTGGTAPQITGTTDTTQDTSNLITN